MGGNGSHILVGVIEIACGLAILAIIIDIFSRRSKNRTQAKEYLTSIIDEMKKIVMETAVECAAELPNMKFDSVKAFEDYVVDKSLDKVWKAVEFKLDKAVMEGVVPEAVRKIINQEYFDNFLHNSLDKLDCGSYIRGLYCNNVVANSSEEMIKEDEKLQEQFSSEDYFEDEEEVDNLKPGDLEPDDTKEEYKLVGDNELIEKVDQEINPPQDELDITQDEAVTELVQDGLTEEEIAAGIHFNKAGRKVDARGKFVKAKK